MRISFQREFMYLRTGGGTSSSGLNDYVVLFDRVGGRGQKAFWVFSQNYDWQWSAGELQPRPVNGFEDLPYGEWRLELEPGDTALEHNFLTVVDLTPGAGYQLTSLLEGSRLTVTFLRLLLV
jgi:hypothetical protein